MSVVQVALKAVVEQRKGLRLNDIPPTVECVAIARRLTQDCALVT